MGTPTDITSCRGHQWDPHPVPCALGAANAADPIDLRPLRKEEGYPGEGSREREEEELEEREDEFRMKKKGEEKKN